MVTESNWIPEAPRYTSMTIRILSEPFIFLYTLTHGVYFTTLPQVLLYKSCLGKFNQTLCDPIDNKLSRTQQAQVFSVTTLWNMILAISTISISLTCILPFGALSDIISKKKLMLIPPVLRLIQSLIFILDIQLETSRIELLVIGACLTGLYGDIQGALSLASAYMADGTSDGPERTARMIGLGASSYAGSGIGAFLSGILANNYGFIYSFLLSVSISLINIVLVVCLLPAEPWRQHGESQHMSGQEEFQDGPLVYMIMATKKTFTSIYQFIRKYCCTTEGTSICLLIFSYFFGMLCLNGETAILTLFIKHSPLSLSSLAVGEYILLLMAVRGLGGFILFLIINGLKLADAYVVFLGFFSFIGSYIAMALSSTQTMLFSFSPLSIGYPLTLSGLRSCLTKRVKVSEHGTVLSFASFVSLMGSIAMTFSISSLFKYTAEIFPGISILLLAGCGGLGLTLALIVAGLDKCSCLDVQEYEVLTNEKKSEKSVAVKEAHESYPLLKLHNRRK